MRSLVRVQDGPLSGGIAQLVERLLCKQDVSGSSPLTSTNFNFDCDESLDTSTVLAEKRSKLLSSKFSDRPLTTA